MTTRHYKKLDRDKRKIDNTKQAREVNLTSYWSGRYDDMTLYRRLYDGISMSTASMLFNKKPGWTLPG